MPNLYIIAGCNGAGKTTASFTILPEVLECKEFVNADSIAAGLSPFNPESVAMEAGRLMLSRIHELMAAGVDLFGMSLMLKVSRVEMNKSPLDELSDKILKGMAEASRKLVERSAANGRSLVISENGEVRRVPAQDLLSKFSGKA